MSDSEVKVVIETKSDKILSVWTSSSYTRTAILDWESVDIAHAKYLLADFGDTLSMGARSKLTDLIIQSEKEKNLKALGRMIDDHLTSSRLYDLIEYCKKNLSVSIYDAVQKLMNGARQTMSNPPPIRVSENPDGSFTLEWDEDYPGLEFLNSMTDSEVQEWFTKAIEDALKHYEDHPQT